MDMKAAVWEGWASVSQEAAPSPGVQKDSSESQGQWLTLPATTTT